VTIRILLLFFLSSICFIHNALADSYQERFEKAYGPKLYKIETDKSFARFVTKMCTADIIKGEFTDFSGEIYFDREAPENSRVDVTINAASLSLDREYHKDELLKDIIEGEQILKTPVFPVITLKSTKIERTSLNTGFMTADLTLVGETHPIKFEITFENTMSDRYARQVDRKKVAFSAYGTFKRSDWNVLYGLDRVGIRRMSDDVQVFISVSASPVEE